MKELTRPQLTAMLLLTDVFALFCLRGGVSPVTAAAFAAAGAVQMIMMLPLLAYIRRGHEFSRGAVWILFASTVMWGGRLFTMLWNAADVIFIPPEDPGDTAGRMLSAGLIAAVCIYASSEGKKALARASVIAAAFGAVCLAAVAVSAVTGAEWDDLALAVSERGAAGDFAVCFSMSGGLAAFILLLPETKGRAGASAAVYFAAKGGVSAVMILTAAIVTGGIMQIAEYPVITAAQLSQPFRAQRIDALFLLIFAVFAVFALAVQTAAAAGALGKLIPGFTRYRSSAVTAAMLAAAFLPVNTGIQAIVPAAVLLTVPAVQFIADQRGGRK